MKSEGKKNYRKKTHKRKNVIIKYLMQNDDGLAINDCLLVLPHFIYTKKEKKIIIIDNDDDSGSDSERATTTTATATTTPANVRMNE